MKMKSIKDGDRYKNVAHKVMGHKELHALVNLSNF